MHYCNKIMKSSINDKNKNVVVYYGDVLEYERYLDEFKANFVGDRTESKKKMFKAMYLNCDALVALDQYYMDMRRNATLSTAVGPRVVVSVPRNPVAYELVQPVVPVVACDYELVGGDVGVVCDFEVVVPAVSVSGQVSDLGPRTDSDIGVLSLGDTLEFVGVFVDSPIDDFLELVVQVDYPVNSSCFFEGFGCLSLKCVFFLPFFLFVLVVLFSRGDDDLLIYRLLLVGGIHPNPGPMDRSCGEGDYVPGFIRSPGDSRLVTRSYNLTPTRSTYVGPVVPSGIVCNSCTSEFNIADIKWVHHVFFQVSLSDLNLVYSGSNCGASFSCNNDISQVVGLPAVVNNKLLVLRQNFYKYRVRQICYAVSLVVDGVDTPDIRLGFLFFGEDKSVLKTVSLRPSDIGERFEFSSGFIPFKDDPLNYAHDYRSGDCVDGRYMSDLDLFSFVVDIMSSRGCFYHYRLGIVLDFEVDFFDRIVSVCKQIALPQVLVPTGGFTTWRVKYNASDCPGFIYCDMEFAKKMAWCADKVDDGGIDRVSHFVQCDCYLETSSTYIAGFSYRVDYMYDKICNGNVVIGLVKYLFSTKFCYYYITAGVIEVLIDSRDRKVVAQALLRYMIVNKYMVMVTPCFFAFLYVRKVPDHLEHVENVIGDLFSFSDVIKDDGT